MPATIEQQIGLGFDILSYPCQGSTPGLIIETGDNLAARIESGYGAHILRLGESTVSLAAPEAAAYYQEITARRGRTPESMMLISDRAEHIDTALQLGMGVARIDEPGGVEEALGLLANPRAYTDQELYQHPLASALSYDEVNAALFKPGHINVVGFIGRTGAGKSTTINRLIENLNASGGEGSRFEIDSFFIRSRQERKAWLNEPGISESERAKRQRVINWWDLDLATATLDRIRSGEHVHMEGLYDMRQGGEKVGTLDIDPGSSGHTVFVEGTALLIPALRSALDSIVYFNTHDQTRAELLMQRNLADGYSPEESTARKALTDAAETNDHISKTLRVSEFMRGRLTVLDNTDRRNYLRLLPPYIPKI
jgi:uridine kinase